jgi:hypothetical protein
MTVLENNLIAIKTTGLIKLFCKAKRTKLNPSSSHRKPEPFMSKSGDN